MADETMSIVKSVSQRLATFMDEEQNYKYSLDNKIEKLQLDLEWCRHILEVLAEEKTENSYLDIVQTWMSHIREFAYEARQILENYTLQISRAEGGDGCCSCSPLRRTCRCDCERKALKDISSRIDSLSCRVLDLASRMRFRGVGAALPPNWICTTRSSEETTTDTTNNQTTEDNDIITVRFEGDAVSKLTQQLIDRDEKESEEVAVIYGQPGCGKTTLAKMVCRDADVRKHFDCFVWVPPSSGTRKVLEGIWLELHGGDYYDQRKKIRSTELDKLKNMIKAALRLKKLLVVVDDVWNDGSSIDVLRAVSSLVNSSSTSKLMLITSSEEMQRMAITNRDYYQPVLSDDQCLELLRKVVSAEQDPTIDALVNTFGNEMTKRCKNNPLVIIVLGGILAHKHTSTEWEEVDKYTKKEFREDSVLQDVMELSFLELPAHLKPYLLHVGNLPRDIQIPANKLYRIWIAEGLIRSSPPNSPEDVARDYLKELVDRGLVQVVSRGKNGKVKAFRVHHTMRRICKKKTTELNCHIISTRDIVHAVKSKKIDAKAAKSDAKAVKSDAAKAAKSGATTKGGKKGDAKGSAQPSLPPPRPVYAMAATLSTRVLHGLAVRVDNDRGDNDIRNLSFPDGIVKNCGRLQSLLFLTNNSDGSLPRGWLRSLVGGSSELRVLHVENARISAVPEHVGRLVHLKYLSLRGTTVTHELPSSIGELSLLETLDLRVFPSGPEPWFLGIGTTGSSDVKVPDVFWKLRKLRHLYLPETYVCSMFSRKLHFHGLINLEILKNLNLRLCKVKGLKDLTGLKKFTWKVDDAEDMFELGDKKILTALLGCPYVTPSGGTSNSSSTCPKKGLVIKVDAEWLSAKYVPKFPTLDGSIVQGMIIMGSLNMSSPAAPTRWECIKKILANLTTLVLRSTDLVEDPMPILGDLENLKNLRLSYNSFTGTEMTSGKFPQLVYLKLDMLSELEIWTVEDGAAMPKLKFVEIEYCGKLQQIPDGLAEGVKVHCLLPCVPGDRTKHGDCPHSEEPRQSSSITDSSRDTIVAADNAATTTVATTASHSDDENNDGNDGGAAATNDDDEDNDGGAPDATKDDDDA